MTTPTKVTATPHLMIPGMMPGDSPEALTDAVCPYCGTQQKILINPVSRKPQIVLCDNEEVDGCDCYFVVYVTLQAVTEASGIGGN